MNKGAFEPLFLCINIDMANIFTNAVNFLGATLKQTVTADLLRDFQHAHKLFVGNEFALVPKSGYLFHVFIDVNPRLGSSFVLGSDTLTEMGLMVKSADLPKFSIENKLYNAYNRPNYVQNKIKFDPVNISFHDDSMNVIRNFWYDYYRYYYRDSDSTEQQYYINYKYTSDPLGNWGFSRRQESSENYIKSIRVYSLSRSNYTEYIYINPIITAFRHGEHDYMNVASSNMTNTMTFAYENVLYSDGAVSPNEVKGFADIMYYDRRPSPLNRIGSRRSVFGRNGLLDTAGSVINDIMNGNFISAIFKTASARQTFKGVNIAKAAKNEMKQIFTQTATGIITGAITNQMRQSGNRSITVPSPLTLDNVVKNAANGIARDTSAIALVGAGLLVNSLGSSNKYKATPLTQANNKVPVSNYSPGFPSVPGATVRVPAPTTVLKSSDLGSSAIDTNQSSFNVTKAKVELNQNSKLLEKQIQTYGNEMSATEKQVAQVDIVIANLNNKLTIARNSSASQSEISGLINQIELNVSQRQEHISRLDKLKQEIADTQSKLNLIIKQLNAIRNV